MPIQTVLFVCVHNAGRSVMAEALFNRAAAGRARALSAGTAPGSGPHAEVVQAMAEIGIDVAAHRPRFLAPQLVDAADRIVTMGCSVDSALCPAGFLAAEDWALEDPKGKPLEAVRAIRDEILARVGRLVDDLAVQGEDSSTRL